MVIPNHGPWRESAAVTHNGRTVKLLTDDRGNWIVQEAGETVAGVFGALRKNRLEVAGIAFNEFLRACRSVGA